MHTRTQINGILSPYLQKIRFKKAVPYIVGNRILDVGCSQGEILQYIPKEVDYIGVEGNPTCYDYAKTLNPNHKFLNLYIDGHSSSGLQIPERDTVLMLAILEHLNKPLETLQNIKCYLRIGGRIIITTPASCARHILKIGSKLGIFFREIDEHKSYLSKKDLRHICTTAGMNVIHYSKFEFGTNQLVVLEK